MSFQLVDQLYITAQDRGPALFPPHLAPILFPRQIESYKNIQDQRREISRVEIETVHANLTFILPVSEHIKCTNMIKMDFSSKNLAPLQTRSRSTLKFD